MELVLGIDFPLPPLVSQFINELPRGVYDGVAVSVEGVMEILRLGPLNAPVETDADRERRGAKRKHEASGTALSLIYGPIFDFLGPFGALCSLKTPNSDHVALLLIRIIEQLLGSTPPARDVYRARQSARMAERKEDV